MSGLPDDPFAALRSTGEPGTCNPFSGEHKLPTMHADPPVLSGIDRLDAKLDLLLAEIMELRRLINIGSDGVRDNRVERALRQAHALYAK